MSPISTYTNTNGKTVYRYELEAASLRDAPDQIPGDFLLYWWNQDRRTFFIEIVRTLLMSAPIDFDKSGRWSAQVEEASA